MSFYFKHCMFLFGNLCVNKSWYNMQVVRKTLLLRLVMSFALFSCLWHCDPKLCEILIKKDYILFYIHHNDLSVGSTFEQFYKAS